MSVIDSIELYFVNVPLPAPFSPAWVPNGTRSATASYVIRLRTDDGVEGFSSFTAVGRERAGIGDTLAQLFLGRDPNDIEYVQERLRIPAYGGIRNYWVEPAFWDIKGKLAGKPVCELLGGKPVRLKLYASSGEVKDPKARIDEAEARLAEGFTAMKMRVHDFDEAVDIRQVQQPARALAGRMKFSVDCNQAARFFANGTGPIWDLARAKRFVDACHDVGIAWVEEPLMMEWYAQLAELAAYSRVPVAGGEIHTSGLPELSEMIDKRCYHIFQPDAVWTGGIAQTFEIARRARKAGLGFTAHSWTNGIGFAINMQLMAASGFAGELPFEFPVCPPGWPHGAGDRLLTEPWRHERGTLQVPSKPGLGFDIDEDALSYYGRCFFRAQGKTVVWIPEALRDLSAPPFRSIRKHS